MEKKLNIIAIVQARLESSRLPNKVLEKMNGETILEIINKRLKLSKMLSNIVFAIPKNEKKLMLFLKRKKIKFFLGSSDNVLERYYKCAKHHKADIILRITGDCPIIDSELVDQAINSFLMSKKVDLLTNNFPPTYPDGLDLSLFTFKVLKQAYKNAKSKYDKEHVVTYMIRLGKIKKNNIYNKENLSSYRWTLDEKEDLYVIRKIFNHFKKNTFSWRDVLTLHKKQPEIFEENSHIKRDEGSKINNGQKLWKRAKTIIPGGNMLLSKRPDYYLQGRWPTYYKKAKDCFIWDLDGNKFLDMSMMGVGTNTLGYGNKKVDEAVKKTILYGNMSTLNCSEEVTLAEKLISIHPWADMCKLTRSGGEANAVAIRIARSSTKKHKVAVCGYHGWHDWYIAANLLSNDRLNNHLISGLSPRGVPKDLAGTTYTFKYNNFSDLKKLIDSDKDIGIIKMEVSRNYPPKPGYLQQIRKLCDKKNLILIFDECTSGFRQIFGGLHKMYNVDPDMAIFGKALGNGYAINAIIGKRNLMKNADRSFISSTFWTERIGPTAALKTLEEMEKIKSWKIITNKGNYIRKQWTKIAKKFKLKLEILGLPSISSFIIKSKNFSNYRTLISQELLKDKILATNTVYLSTKHDKSYIDKYLKSLEKIFRKINDCENNKCNIEKLLEESQSKNFFERLN